MDRNVVLTYKRKRFFSQANLAHDGTAASSSPDFMKGISSGIFSPKAEPDIDDKKLNGDNMNIPREKVQYIKRHVPEDSLQQQFPEKKRRKSSSDMSEMGPMKLRSQKVLSSRKTAEDGFRNMNPSSTTADVDISMDFSCSDSGTVCKVPHPEGSSSSTLADLDNIRQPIPECFNSAPEKKSSSGCLQNLTSKTSDSDNVLLNRELPKENCNTPLITFYRRTKKKQFISETTFERNLNSDDNKCSFVNCNSHALQASCQPNDSTQKIRFKDQSTTAAVSQDQIDLSPQNMHEQVVMNDANKVTFPESAPKGSILEIRIGGGSSDVSPVHSGPKSCHVNRVHEEPLNKCMEAARNDAIEGSVLMPKNKQLDLVKNVTAVRAKLGSNLMGAVNNSEKMNTPHCVSERFPISDLNLPVVPPSSANSSNIDRCKLSVDAVPGNLLESQSSSTPGCEITLDEEADGRGKELEWLDSLDKDLQQSKSERNILSSGEQVNTNYGQASRGRASPIVANKSSTVTPCNQDLTREYTNAAIPLRERLLLSRPRETGSEKRQHEEASNEAPLCTNLLGPSLHLSSKLPVHSIKGFQNMLSQSNLCFNYSGHLHEGQLPWHAVGQNSSLIRSKQMVEDVISGSGIVKERRGSWLDKYQRNSYEWSEEELDFLWIGVRRHGMFNWNAMLTDPKLHFLESRVAEDLAKRWDLEQRKLLNGTLLPPVSLSRPVLSSSMSVDAFLAKPADAFHYGNYNARPRFPIPQAETRLSLGNAHLQKENISKRNIFHPSSVSMNDLLTSATPSTVSLTSSLPMGPTSQMAGIRQQKLMRNGNAMYDRDIYRQKSGESSIRELQSSSLQPSNSLPHWLKGALLTPPAPNLPVLSHVSTVSHAADLLNSDLQAAPSFPNIGESSAASKDTRGRGILKRKSPASANNVGSLRVSDPSMSTKVSYLPSLCVTSKRPASDGLNPDKRNNMCDLNKRSDLVVVDSDASSEETISDDQSRP